MSQTVVLITGASRGIGSVLVAKYLARPHTTVVATVRDLSSENASRLRSMKCRLGSKLIVLPLDFNIPSAAADAILMLKEKYDIQRLDIVISNAGICNTWARVEDVTDSDAMAHLEVNTLGLLRLYRAVVPLLNETDMPKLVYITSELASMGRLGQSSSLTASYGMSKAAGNYLIEKINSENDKLVAFSISPGFVQTDMGNKGARYYGLQCATMTVEESTEAIITQIDAAPRATTFGGFLNYNGTSIPCNGTVKTEA